MSHIPEELVAKLQGRKLLVKGNSSDGLMVCKPKSAGGNRIPYYKVNTGDESLAIDAPILSFYFSNQKWCVRHWECAPGPGPGDFVHSYETADEAVDDILDYYFGDISRMQPLIDLQLRTHAKRHAWETRQLKQK